MNRARALGALLALLPACLTFPDAESYVCSADDGCPSGWLCDGARCVNPGGPAALEAACSVACDELYSCGFSASCQLDSTCPFGFMYETDASSCASACSDDPEGLSAAELNCFATAECDSSVYDDCLGL